MPNSGLYRSLYVMLRRVWVEKLCIPKEDVPLYVTLCQITSIIRAYGSVVVLATSANRLFNNQSMQRPKGTVILNFYQYVDTLYSSTHPRCQGRRLGHDIDSKSYSHVLIRWRQGILIVSCNLCQSCDLIWCNMSIFATDATLPPP